MHINRRRLVLFLYIYININTVLFCTPKSSKPLLYFRFANQTPVRFFVSVFYLPRPSHPPWFSHPNIMFENDYKANQRANWGTSKCASRESAVRRPSVCVAIPALTASLGLVTDSLIYNGNCAYANDFPSRLKTPTWANWGPLLKRQ